MLGPETAIRRSPFTRRRLRLRHRVLVFSVAFALLTVLFAGLFFFIVDVYRPLGRLNEVNRSAFENIHCDAQSCDIAQLANDWETTTPDYVLDKDSLFLLNIDSPAAEFGGFPFRYSDHSFIMRFKTPGDVITPAGESWRLYSEVHQLGSKSVVVMVGYALRASWKMDVNPPPTGLIDEGLKKQLDVIAARLGNGAAQVELLTAAQRRKIAADGYEIVDLINDEILDGGHQIPVYLPRTKPIPAEGFSFWKDKNDLYLVRTDASDRFVASSTHFVGEWRSIVSVFVLLFVASGIVAYVLGNTLLRKYFVFRQGRPVGVEEALRLGEGPEIEFKRNISFESTNSTEQILQSVAAFANTGDGTIFIGIDDNGRITGIEVNGVKHKDRYSERLHQLVRTRIMPPPSIQVAFVSLRDFTILVLFVPRGEEPLYFMDGVVYVREGSSDLTARHDIVKRILTEYRL
jgi:hypothetical protein